MTNEADSPLRKIERTPSLGNQAYDRVRRELLPGGSLHTAERLVERELAERLSMSRTPVRDALRRLAVAGIVEPLKGGGYIRRRVTIREVEEVHELLLLLEPLAVRMAAYAEPAVVEGLLASEAVVGRDLSPTANTRFHVAVAEASGNVVLARVVATLNERLSVGHELFGPSDAVGDRSLADGHDEIVEALALADAERAAEAMERHIALGQDLLSRRLRTGSEPSSG